jgi:hypothetical protein
VSESERADSDGRRLDANEWIYYQTPGVVDRVVFVDDRIRSISRGPAPQ